MVDLMELAWVRRDDSGIAASPWIGHLVGGKYRITGVLGRGGMGTVYRAVHELSLSPAAVKVLHARFANDPRYREQLMAEARRASRVRGEHIAQVLDVGETHEGSIYIAMELVEGETLQALLNREGILKPAQVLTLLDLTCHALEEMGRAGLVHRDVSPSNLMLTRRGRSASLKILDLGIAQIPEEKDPAQGAGLWINPPYTAPEVLQGETGTQQADLYSLGVVAYQALTGTLPHGGETTQERVHAVLEEDALPLELPRGTPRRLGSLIRRLMAKDVTARPSSATEALERIRAIRRPKRPLQRAASIVIFLAGLVLLTLSLTRRSEATLMARPGSIRLSSALPRDDAKPQALQLEELREQTFEAHGIGPGDLVLDCLFYADGSSRTFVLKGRRKGPDLSFSVKEDSGWREFYEAVKARGGRVTLSFRREGRSVAHAKLFVDLRAPRFAEARLESRGGGKVLLQDSVFVARVEEDGLPVEVTFQLLDAQSRALHRFTRPVQESGILRIELGRILRGKPGTASGSPANLRVELRDLSGRVSEPWNQILEHVDLSVPEIRAAESAEGSQDLLLAGERCEILLWLSSDVVPGDIQRVEVQVGTGSGASKARSVPFDVEPGKIRVHLDLPDLADQENLLLEFRLVDNLGNQSRLYSQRFALRVLDLKSSFRSRPLSQGRQAPFLFTADGRTLLLEKPPFLLVYQCNPDYEPQLQTQGLPSGVRMQVHSAGLCIVWLDASLNPASEFVLRFQHRVAKTGRLLLRSRTLEVRLLPKAPSIARRKEWMSGRLWSGQLVQAGFLERKGSDEFRIRLGQHLALDRPPESGAKAWLWQSGPSGWRRVSELSSGSPLVLLDRGRNRFALEALDDLGRTLVDSAGLEEHVQVGESRLLPFLDCRHDSRGPLSQDIFFEYGSQVRLTLDFPQVFQTGTRVRLSPSWQVADMDAAVLLDVEPRKGGGSRGSAVLEFDKVRRWCGLEGTSKAEFGKLAGISRRFRIQTPAGDHSDIELRFQPMRSLLRVQDLASILRSHRAQAVSEQKMIPFLGADELLFGLVRSRFQNLPGTLLVSKPIIVVSLPEFFLSQTEISRREYLRFVEHILSGKVDASLVKQLGHAEDPLGAKRFTRDGLQPLGGLFRDMDLKALVEADGDRPVTGIDYYQASAYCRWLSLQAFGNPDMLRLPFAAELVLAAVHRFPQEQRQDHLNGLYVPGQKWRSVEEAWRMHVRLARTAVGLDPRRWPLNREELKEVGDYSLGLSSVRGAGMEPRCYGVDFGVREWVEDLPLAAGAAVEVVRILIGSHPEHLRFTQDRREGRKKDVIPPEIVRLGVIRGLGFAEPAFRGRDPLHLGYLKVPGPGGKPARFGDPALLGVRRTENAKRDGILSGDRKNPFLRVVGFRLAGTGKFMDMAKMGKQ